MSGIRKLPSSLVGLQSAVPGDLNAVDPLGIDAQQRGVDAYEEAKRAGDPNYLSGPLADRQWAGFFQTLADHNVSRLAQDSAAPQGLADASDYGQLGDVGALAGVNSQGRELAASVAPSRNIATPPTRRRAALSSDDMLLPPSLRALKVL